MASESETVMDVCAEWRACIESADPSVWNDERIAGLVKTTKAQQLEYLARIEAAWKRVVVSKTETTTVGNAAALRETLAGIRALIADEPDGTPMIDAMKATIDAALSAPARQCDVGTAEEQTKRFRRFCNNTKCQYCNITVNKGSCSFNWAQMPYEAELKGGKEC